MANHFTPEELAAELGTGTRDVIQLCVKEGIPIYKGKIDRSLLTAVMRTKGIQLPKTEVATVVEAQRPPAGLDERGAGRAQSTEPAARSAGQTASTCQASASRRSLRLFALLAAGVGPGRTTTEAVPLSLNQRRTARSASRSFCATATHRRGARAAGRQTGSPTGRPGAPRSPRRRARPAARPPRAACRPRPGSAAPRRHRRSPTAGHSAANRRRTASASDWYERRTLSRCSRGLAHALGLLEAPLPRQRADQVVRALDRVRESLRRPVRPASRRSPSPERRAAPRSPGRPRTEPGSRRTPPARRDGRRRRGGSGGWGSSGAAGRGPGPCAPGRGRVR